MPKHHSKLENVLVHSLAILFTFSALFSSFLGYGVYQNNNNVAEDFHIVPKAQAAVQTWTQTSWQGGAVANSEVNVPWGTTGGWNKYSSGTGVTTSGSGFALNGVSNLVSSVYDLGNKRMNYWSGGGCNVSPGLSGCFTRGGNTAVAARSASWTESEGVNVSCSIRKYRYIQTKVELYQVDSSVVSGNFNIYSQYYSFIGNVKDKDTGANISGATVNYGFGSTTTASANPSDSIIKPALAAGSGGFYITDDFTPGKQLSFTVSKSGYKTTTQAVTMPNDVCSGASKLVVITLVKSSSSSSSGTSSSSGSTSTSTGTGTVADTSSTVTLSDFQKTKLPKVFLAKGNKTTVLSKVKDYKKIKDFTLDIPGKNRIVFKETLNLSTQKSIDLLAKLDKYVKMGTAGKIELDSKAFAALNKKATITMEKLKHVSTPEVLVGNKKDTKAVVSNAVFDKDKETLSFDVAHFTTFEAVPKLELISPQETTNEQNPSIVGQISDPAATITGRFNEVDLAPIDVNKETGQFTIANLLFKEGDNFLTLEAKSKLGKVLPVVSTIVYDPSGTAAAALSTSGPNNQLAIMATILIGALAFLVILGYLVYRRRKHGHPSTSSKESPPTQTPESPPPVNPPKVAAPEVFHT